MSIIDKLFDYSSIVYSDILVRFILAAVIILIGFVVGRLLGKVVHRVLHEIELDKMIKSATKRRLNLEEATGRVTSYLIYFFVIIMALNQLGLTTPLLYLISAAIILVLLISFVLAVRDFIPNFFAGLSIQGKGFIHEGDILVFRGMRGKVEQINLTETRLVTKTGDTISIPNSLLLKYEVKKSKKL
ncbi:mechanosensitive ion channel [Candidatus Woesearchaeota archaeon]|nr:mechanosensitive ion channel [Candidatus Woesearchaeota archaeon]